MTETLPNEPQPTENQAADEKAEPPISVIQILKENWILARALIVFILMLSVPLLIAWKYDLFLVANN